MTEVATLNYIGETMKSTDKNLLVNFSPLLIAAFVMFLMLFASDVKADQPAKWVMCSACHGNVAQGGIGPILAGQSATEIITKLNIYKNGGTIGGRSSMMWGTAKQLTDQDIEDIATYIESLQLTLASR